MENCPVSRKVPTAPFSGERRLLTVVFVDVVDSVSIARTLDPEDWKEIMDRTFARIAEVVYRYEGTIAQLLGDGLLAYFGAPIAHEDDPARAVSVPASTLSKQCRSGALSCAQNIGSSSPSAPA
jgi:class 3 adenylate cyclase